MTSHGRPRGRARPPQRTVPPHVIADRAGWDAYKARTTPEQRARHAALLAGHDPNRGLGALRRAMAQVGEQLELGEAPVGEGIAAAFGGMTCCFCDADISDGRFIVIRGGRLRCFAAECHAAEVRWLEREGG
jgi:hypothetical protein